MEKLKFFAIKTAVWAIYINQQKVNFFAEEEVEVKDFIYMIQKSVSKKLRYFSEEQPETLQRKLPEVIVWSLICFLFYHL